jgi:hypothetical protein
MPAPADSAPWPHKAKAVQWPAQSNRPPPQTKPLKNLSFPAIRIAGKERFIPCDRINFALSNLTREDAIASLLNLSPENKALALEFLIQRLVKAMVAEVDAEVAQTQEISSAADLLRDYRNAQSTTA